eukprot:TRINITY_DN16714_c0_g1_i1.p1 TRINITY_DN16714_c0_g1~~TRINITY_DN16714_c0_g1_i1.p1  ORF type:complete len:260 (+),score=70.89 TRINITY_DN16714_c0_g1_i1:101-781(+)
MSTLTPASNESYDLFKAEANNSEGWTECYKAEGTQVWQKKNKKSAIQVVKVSTVYADVSPTLLYCVLHDSTYRKTWDTNMLEGTLIDTIGPNDEVTYYAAKCPTGIANRDFLNQRYWRVEEDKGEWIIRNHAVEHPDCPDKKGFVRGESIMTGYIVTKEGDGSKLIYLSQADPKGWIPSWVINMLTSKLAPRVIDSMHKAALGYKAWLAENNTTPPAVYCGENVQL